MKGMHLLINFAKSSKYSFTENRMIIGLPKLRYFMNYVTIFLLIFNLVRDTSRIEEV